MSKIKSTEVLSIDTSKQREVVKEIKQLKKQLKEGTITAKDIEKEKKLKVEQRRGLIFISHLPHGFYEEELNKYFKQFGKVTHVQVCRSGRTGNSKGYGYVEFENPDVAKIAAETMNNYLMFKKRIIAEYVPYEKRPKGLFSGKHNTPTRYSVKVRREKQYRANLNLDDQTHIKRTTTRLSKVNKKLAWLEKIGVKPTYTPIDIALIKQEGSSSEEVANTPSKKTKTPSKKSKTPKSRIVKKSSQIKSSKKNAKKTQPLNADTVKKIARELIRKRGKSLLTRPVDKTSKTTKKKTAKK
ncbi:MKI67 FHA domain-interacting nucleolar phosphoprotein-like [Diorhabda carinulata]|uniref:MKI67 FHA domain-interacting nucleolar phosphoprotein-like n=1 Tax=Diorhabda carinulata TaxID=1163345 RepID=UPI0025A0CD2D|nr:MKI67 FHA domain-interacting nucleolar phosphoprotein-like [Diorhabda carinulata]